MEFRLLDPLEVADGDSVVPLKYETGRFVGDPDRGAAVWPAVGSVALAVEFSRL
jgi:hypothetical protein